MTQPHGTPKPLNKASFCFAVLFEVEAIITQAGAKSIAIFENRCADDIMRKYYIVIQIVY